MDSTLSPSTEVDPNLMFIRGPASDLKKFKVLGTIDKVILVLDRSTEETYIIKVSLSSSRLFHNLFISLPSNMYFIIYTVTHAT